MKLMMPDYRLLCFDEVGGITCAKWLDASTDKEAVANAHLSDGGNSCEIWCDQRLVIKIANGSDGCHFELRDPSSTAT